MRERELYGFSNSTTIIRNKIYQQEINVSKKSRQLMVYSKDNLQEKPPGNNLNSKGYLCQFIQHYLVHLKWLDGFGPANCPNMSKI